MYLPHFLLNALFFVQLGYFVLCNEDTKAATVEASLSIEDEGATLELPMPLGKATHRTQRSAAEQFLLHQHAVESNKLTTQRMVPPRRQRTKRPSLMDVALQASAREGLEAMTDLYGRIMPDIVRSGQILADNHPAALLSKFSAPAAESEQAEMAAFATISATKAFRKNYKYFNDLARQAHNPKISLRRTALEGLCPPRDPPTCPAASGRYRTHDGTCNNRRHPRWGSAQMPFNRFLPPEYDDGVDSIRNSVESGPLSSSRFVSLLVHGAKDGEAPLTLMLAMWGQLLDHDLTSTAQPRSINGSVPSCCGRKDFHPSCFPIKVPLDDPWLAPLKVRCLEFLRSAPAQRRDCVLSWREQTNQATSYIDASPIYSNSAKMSDNARVFRNGLLVFGRGNPAEDVCQRGALATQCIRAGDGRSGEQPGLLALHHVWVGEHNRIAMELSEMNQHWSDEKLYQETRRIVGAMFQHITYREFLPIVLGREVCKLFDLELLSSGYYDRYNSKVNPTVANSFASAAFRFGHSLVQNSYIRCDRHHNIIANNVSLHEEFQRGDVGSVGSLHRLLRGMATQRSLKRDEFITPELTNHLFQTPGFPFGLDLAAINIQRGRDHGVPPYTAWRVPCGLTPISNWDDLANVVGPESARRIGHAYRSVHDIDLFVGGIAERPVVGGLVGPTFACIIAQQFSNSRRGDRFWYENGGLENSFTPAQLHSIRRVSLAQVLCLTVSGGTFQPHIFIPAEFTGNERLPCGVGLLTPIDLTPWLEQDPFLTSTHSQLPMDAHIPERIFDILPLSGIEPDILNSVQIIKENKAGFSNRMPLPLNTSSPFDHVPNVDFIPNASTGFQIPKNATNINDKLDIKRKRPTVVRKPTPKPIIGVHNKLDKDRNTKNRQRTKTTTRRTVVINNVPIELRNADTITESPKDSSKTKTLKTKLKPKKTTVPIKTVDGPEPRVDDTDIVRTTDDTLSKPTETVLFIDESAEFLDSDITTELNIIEKSTLTTEPTTSKPLNIDRNDTDPKISRPIKNNTYIKDSANGQTDSNNEELLGHTGFNISNSDLDPLTHSTAKDHKRVQRERFLNITNEFDQARNTRATKIFTKHKFSTSISVSSTSAVPPTVPAEAAISSTNFPRLKLPKTSERTVELRQYENRPIYNRPHKVILDGPNADQYEIEINIRQSNKIPLARPITTYPDYTTIFNKPYAYGYDRYSPNFVDYATPAPPPYQTYGYFQPPPTTAPNTLTQSKRTRPPTIIYLNEHDDRTTTRPPGIFQNFITFATNGLTGTSNKPNSFYTPKDNQLPESSIQGSLSSNPHSSNSATVQYAPRPQSQISSGTSSFSQVGSYAGSGVVHASSSAVSSGNYGSIVGVANANGADSTFSFNIRPQQSSISQTQNYLPSSKPGAGSYGLLPPYKPQVSVPPYENLPISTPQTGTHFDNYNQESVNSPFSTVHIKPQSPGYYSRAPIGPQKKSPTHQGTIHSDIHDYDYQSRTLETLTNLTDSAEDPSSDLEIGHDYDYDDISVEDETVTIGPFAKKYDKDGYLRPEHMLENMNKLKDQSGNNDTKFNNSSALDDDYVLPVLNHTMPLLSDILPMEPSAELLNLTMARANFPNILSTEAKHSINDILAEDYEDNPADPFIISKSAAIISEEKEHAAGSQIAFAPIKVLTNPERPDNWVIFDSPNEEPLPALPEIKTDALATSEFPMPLWAQSKIVLENVDLEKTTEAEIEVTENIDSIHNDAFQLDLQTDINHIPINNSKLAFNHTGDFVKGSTEIPSNNVNPNSK